MSVLRREDIMALEERIEAEARALRKKLDARTDLSEVGEIVATLNELLQSREYTKAILANFEGRDA
jgi:hypothetical protein